METCLPSSRLFSSSGRGRQPLFTCRCNGGVTEPLEENSGPDPLMVDQAEASLYQLHALHINTVCEQSLNCGGIETVIADEKLGKGTPVKKPKEKPDVTEGGIRLPDVPSILKQKSSPLPDSRLHVHDHVGCECEGSTGENSEDSFTHSSRDSSLALEEDEEGDEDSESEWRIFKSSEGRGLHQYDIETKGFANRQHSSSPVRVTSGKETVLFHMVQLEVGEGLLIQPLTPLSSSVSQSPPPFHAQILHTFRATCAHIHHVLHAGVRVKEPIGSYNCGPALSGVKEHGVLFSYTPPVGDSGNGLKRRNQTFSYWVVGRLIPAPYQREVYVCYHESIPQNILEVAFKTSLGSVV